MAASQTRLEIVRAFRAFRLGVKGLGYRVKGLGDWYCDGRGSGRRLLVAVVDL